MRIFRTGSLCRRRHKAALIAEQNLTFCSRSFDASVCGMEVTMENTQSVKSLKKQLMAAIAMVLVAAIALGSSTYAWFVSNNKVDATTNTISAQSNSAYLVIDTKTTSKTSTSSATATETENIKLYPAQVVNGNGQTYKFESAYAAKADVATEKTDTRFTVGTNGTGEEAVTNKYAHKDTFYIGTGGYDGKFTDLKVSDVEVTATTDEAKTVDMTSAMRVLVVCGDKWVVWKNGAAVNTVNTLTNSSLTLTPNATDNVIADAVSKEDEKTVDVYVFYDGAESEITSNNLTLLKSCKVKVTFDATAEEYGK